MDYVFDTVEDFRNGDVKVQLLDFISLEELNI